MAAAEREPILPVVAARRSISDFVTSADGHTPRDGRVAGPHEGNQLLRKNKSTVDSWFHTAQDRLMQPTGNRRKDFIWIFVANLVLPSIIFTVTFCLIASQLRYQYAYVVLAIILAAHIFVFCVTWFSVWLGKWRFRSTGVVVTLALVIAPLAGDLNYTYNLYPFYVSKALQDRVNLSPITPGDSVKDSGKVYFAEGTRVETNRGMSYVSDDTYCVAPITMKKKSLARYDFWAVGINCCNSNDPNFAECGEVKNEHARAGLRVVYPEQNQYFRLAVQQAESEYDIEAGENPLFFYWVQDPQRESEKFLKYGMETLVLGSILYFFSVNLPAVLLLACFLG